MFRILVVEDDQGTFERLGKRIPKKIPEARVDIAPTVSKARQYLQEVREQGEPYDAIILDIKVPESQGLPPEMDETLCDRIKETMPHSTIVAHISAWLDDEVVQQHMKKKHDEQIDRSFRLSKMEPNWFRELEKKLVSFLYGTRIEAQMNDLFGQDDEPSFTARNRGGRVQSGEDRSVTHKFSALSREIASHWHELDESLQARISRAFEVTHKGNKVIVSFL